MTSDAASPLAALFMVPDGDAAAMVASLGAVRGDVRIGERIAANLPKMHPDTGAPLPLLPCPFAAVALARGAPDVAIPVLRDIVDLVAIDMTQSTLLIGTEHIVKAGDGDVLVTMLVRRRAGLTLETFRRRWLYEHAPFGRRIPVSGYRQLHADRASVPGLPPVDRFDGAGMVFFRDAAHVASARATPEIARDATRDEMQFIDHAGSMLAMFAF